MADDITNSVLLEHIQGLRNDLQQQIHDLRHDLQQQISALDQKVTKLDQKVTNLAEEVHQGFDEAREHRTALQEDLEETMRVQGKHTAKLARV